VKPAFDGGLLVTNPPYGERLERDSDLGRQLARAIDRFPDSKAGLLMEASQPLARTRRKPRLFPLFNGNIACSLRVYAPIDRQKRVIE
jgi:23S rRNA G2445 N2-methylase RlmL